jgi:dihydroorotate dehydrogenase electron transfer subunit
MAAVQVRGEVLSVKPVGAYVAMTAVAPGVAEQARPGQFVAVAVGDQATPMLLRRAFSLHRVNRRGVYGGTVEFVFAVAGAGTAWLARRRPHDTIDVVGPLGRGFALPRSPANCLLVGGGYGSAPLFLLADRLHDRGCRVSVVLGAATADRVFGALKAKRTTEEVVVTTEDGSTGQRGRVSDVLGDVITRTRAEAVYACGPMGMLATVSAIAAEAGDGAGIPCQVAVEESMACGIGVCMTCVLPVRDAGGQTRMVRSCVEGPAFRAEQVRWDDLGRVPADALGAAAMGAGYATA